MCGWVHGLFPSFRRLTYCQIETVLPTRSRWSFQGEPRRRWLFRATSEQKHIAHPSDTHATMRRLTAICACVIMEGTGSTPPKVGPMVRPSQDFSIQPAAETHLVPRDPRPAIAPDIFRHGSVFMSTPIDARSLLSFAGALRRRRPTLVMTT